MGEIRPCQLVNRLIFEVVKGEVTANDSPK